ncbi:hypothetical protein MRX96_029241 [Rhipicephalus microplus]
MCFSGAGGTARTTTAALRVGTEATHSSSEQYPREARAPTLRTDAPDPKCSNNSNTGWRARAAPEDDEDANALGEEEEEKAAAVPYERSLSPQSHFSFLLLFFFTFACHPGVGGNDDGLARAIKSRLWPRRQQRRRKL